MIVVFKFGPVVLSDKEKEVDPKFQLSPGTNAKLKKIHQPGVDSDDTGQASRVTQRPVGARGDGHRRLD